MEKENLTVTWFDEVKMELENIEPTKEPPYTFDPEDKRIGVVESTATRKLFTLAMKYRRAYAEQKLKSSFERVEDVEAHEFSLRELDAKADSLMELFWTCLRAEFGLWGNYVVGIRLGWTVVTSPPKESALNRFLGALDQGR